MDIQKTDTISMVVKREKAEEIREYYQAFGHKLVQAKDDKRYGNIVHLKFEREHAIKDKDRLQLYQVRMENAVNTIAKAENGKYAVSVGIGIVLGIIALLLMIFGIKAIVSGTFEGLFVPILCCSVATVIFVANGFCCKIIHVREKEAFKKIESENKSIIWENCDKARRILNENQEIERTSAN